MKDERLYIRVTLDQKSLMSDAATAEGLTLSAWVIRTLMLASKRASKREKER